MATLLACLIMISQQSADPTRQVERIRGNKSFRASTEVSFISNNCKCFLNSSPAVVAWSAASPTNDVCWIRRSWWMEAGHANCIDSLATWWRNNLLNQCRENCRENLVSKWNYSISAISIQLKAVNQVRRTVKWLGESPLLWELWAGQWSSIK